MRFRALSLRLQLAIIALSCSLADVTAPLTALGIVDPEAYGGTSGQITAFKYISYEFFNTLYEATGDNALYTLGSKWIALDKFEILVNEKFYSIFFLKPGLIQFYQSWAYSVPKGVYHP